MKDPDSDYRTTAEVLEDLSGWLARARADLGGALNTGLDDRENRELLQTMDMKRAVHLVLKGLRARFSPNSSA